MKEFLQFVVGQLVDRPAEVSLRAEEHGEVQNFFLELPRSEVGKVIGKQGHTIHAIRKLLTSTAARHGGRATLEIVERSEAEAA